jgi:hypothetical protein
MVAIRYPVEFVKLSSVPETHSSSAPEGGHQHQQRGGDLQAKQQLPYGVFTQSGGCL